LPDGIKLGDLLAAAAPLDGSATVTGPTGPTGDQNCWPASARGPSRTGALVCYLPPGRYAVKYTGWRHIGRWLVAPPTGAPVGLDVVQLAYKEWWQK